MGATVSDFIVQRLYDWGVRRMFGYPGDGINGMMGALRRAQEKIRFILRDDWTSMEHGHHAIVTITTNTGKRLEEDVWYRPMTRLELERKFDGLVAPQFGAQRARALLGLLQNIETASSIRTLMEKLRT